MNSKTKKEVIDIDIHKETLLKIIMACEQAAKNLQQISDYDQNTQYDNIIICLGERERFLCKELRACQLKIEEIQKTCQHQFVYSGHDSHYNYEKCEFCGLEVKA